jgi:16S rRNA (uracil1498-N3)-methyltransferase
VSPSTFFVPDLSATDRTVCVRGPEARHAIAVQRIGPGERIDLVNGQGLRFRTTVLSVDGAEAMTCAADEIINEPRPHPSITVVQALIKDGELAVDLLTQAGVDRIVPWAAQRSVVHWRGDRAGKAHAKWMNAARAAAKQSRRAWWPDIAPLASTAEVNALIEQADIALVCDADGGETITAHELPSEGHVVVVVGPEGGCAPNELVGGRRVTLGPGVWRSATAGLAAVVALLAGSDRWQVGG